ncbi:proline iminopeptidase-like [Impatiens glandulifera]|uniref:proline iminopeptidase-like n=1 Tax=Impatiens glandulifera TaxID=253017 RepID=UPI001FB04D8C|nr:proline iminopeptidase-like [Impatiens glandulifera]
MYPDIEPYSTGVLKVSDVHSYYLLGTVWESRSGHLGSPFKDHIPENEKGSFINAYWKRLNSENKETQYGAAREWTKWEMMTAHLLPSEETIKRGDDDEFSLGRYDVCCPMMSAWDLHKSWPESELIVVPDAGHSANEPGVSAELVAANEKLKSIVKGIAF